LVIDGELAAEGVFGVVVLPLREAALVSAGMVGGTVEQAAMAKGVGRSWGGSWVAAGVGSGRL
jgi:hypothetical protein